MRVAIVGAGAIGAYLGGQLSIAGEEVTVIARGLHLQAMQKHGITLLTGAKREVTEVRAVATPDEAGPHDIVFLTLKAHQISEVAKDLRSLFMEHTPVVTAQNGVPWWYFHKLEGPLSEMQLHSVDPGGKIWQAIGPERAIGCVVYPATEIIEPGVVRHIEGNRFSIGEPNGTKSDRVRALSALLVKAGLRAPIRSRLRNELWIKLWGNIALNPISALTRSTLSAICKDPSSRALARSVMLEVVSIAEALGETFAIDVDQRLNAAEAVGEHKTSMLQDVELGRPLEISALIGAVCEIGALVKVPTPHTEYLYGLVRLLDHTISNS